MSWTIDPKIHLAMHKKNTLAMRVLLLIDLIF